MFTVYGGIVIGNTRSIGAEKRKYPSGQTLTHPLKCLPYMGGLSSKIQNLPVWGKENKVMKKDVYTHLMNIPPIKHLLTP